MALLDYIPNSMEGKSRAVEKLVTSKLFECFKTNKKYKKMIIDQILQTGQRSHHFSMSLKDVIVFFTDFDPVSGNLVLCVPDLS
jgi:hypothetical protein